VLHHTRFLVVGLLEEEAVVLDGAVLSASGRGGEEAEEGEGSQEAGEEGPFHGPMLAREPIRRIPCFRSGGFMKGLALVLTMLVSGGLSAPESKAPASRSLRVSVSANAHAFSYGEQGLAGPVQAS
jgi:hypothetical protein